MKVFPVVAAAIISYAHCEKVYQTFGMNSTQYPNEDQTFSRTLVFMGNGKAFALDKSKAEYPRNHAATGGCRSE